MLAVPLSIALIIALERIMDRILRVAQIVLMGIIMVNVMTLTHLLSSYIEATNQIAVCNQDGRIGCHIERDGFNYNVYGY